MIAKASLPQEVVSSTLGKQAHTANSTEQRNVFRNNSVILMERYFCHTHKKVMHLDHASYKL